MVYIELTEKHASTLRDILANDLSDLRMEISHTDSKDFRDNLKEKKEVLETVLGLLEADRTPSL